MKKKTAAKKPVARWGESALSLRERILKQYTFDSLGHEVLTNLLDAHQRMTEAREALARDGLVVLDRFGQPKAHPCFEMESVSRAAVLKHARALGVDIANLSESEES